MSITRRDLLRSQLLLLPAIAGAKLTGCSRAVLGQNGPPKAKAKSLVFIHLVGGPSQVETFDYKPELYRSAGKRIAGFNSEKKQSGGTIMSPIVQFKRHGQSGAWVSELLPHLAKHVDDLTFVKSVACTSLEHMQAQLELFTGSIIEGYPSAGAWINYALGRPNGPFPNVAGMHDPLGPPRSLLGIFERGPLPNTASYAVFVDPRKDFGDRDAKSSIPYDAKRAVAQQVNKLRELGAYRDSFYSRRDELFDVSIEVRRTMREHFKPRDYTEEEKRLYGVTKYFENPFADQLMAARDLLEKEVPYIQIHCGDENEPTGWDHHFNIRDMIPMSKKMDQPVAGFLTDLKNRGLLDQTVVFWGGEFGRTPIIDEVGTPEGQPPRGRGHNNRVNTVWFAGAGLKPGMTLGETDELSLSSVRDIVNVGDLWATMLHLLGVDHHKLAFHDKGADISFTKEFHEVIRDILA
jgi:hypothetical protein